MPIDLKISDPTRHVVFQPSVRQAVYSNGHVVARFSPVYDPEGLSERRFLVTKSGVERKYGYRNEPCTLVRHNGYTTQQPKTFADLLVMCAAEVKAAPGDAPVECEQFDAAITVGEGMRWYCADNNVNLWTDSSQLTRNVYNPDRAIADRSNLLSVLCESVSDMRVLFPGCTTPYFYARGPGAFFRLHFEQLFFPAYNRAMMGMSSRFPAFRSSRAHSLRSARAGRTVWRIISHRDYERLTTVADRMTTDFAPTGKTPCRLLRQCRRLTLCAAGFGRLYLLAKRLCPTDAILNAAGVCLVRVVGSPISDFDLP